MSLDFRHVGETADREAEELTIESSGDRFANTRLSHTRRADEADDLPFDSSAEFADSKEFQDAVLDISKTVVIFIEDFYGVLDREVLF